MTETSTVFEREEARKVGGRGSVPISTQGADGDRLFMFKVIGIDLLERVSDFFPSPGLVLDHNILIMTLLSIKIKKKNIFQS
jgi:hypothetical protein